MLMTYHKQVLKVRYKDSILQTTSPNPIRQIYEKLGTNLQLHIEERDKKKLRDGVE